MEKAQQETPVDNMRRRALIIAAVSAMVLLGVAFYLTLNFNEISVHPRSEEFQDATGKIISYQVPSYAHTHEIGKFFADLFFSLATALIVFLFVEQALTHFDKRQEKRDIEENYRRQKELQEQINKNVFDGVLKNLIPPELFGLLAADVLQKNIIRRNAVWELTFEKNDLNNGFFLTFENSYEFHNIGNNKANLSLLLAATYSTVSKTWYDYLKVQKRDGTPLIERNSLTPIPTPTSNRFESTHSFSLEPNETIKVNTILKTDYCSFQVIDTFWFAYSTIGLEIRVNKIPDTNFKLFPSFTHDLNIERDLDHKITYRKTKAVLIGQSITFLIELVPKLLENQVSNPNGIETPA